MGTQRGSYFVQQRRSQVIETGDIAVVREHPPTVLEWMSICDGVVTMCRTTDMADNTTRFDLL